MQNSRILRICILNFCILLILFCMWMILLQHNNCLLSLVTSFIKQTEKLCNIKHSNLTFPCCEAFPHLSVLITTFISISVNGYHSLLITFHLLHHLQYISHYFQLIPVKCFLQRYKCSINVFPYCQHLQCFSAMKF